MWKAIVCFIAGHRWSYTGQKRYEWQYSHRPYWCGLYRCLRCEREIEVMPELGKRKP